MSKKKQPVTKSHPLMAFAITTSRDLLAKLERDAGALHQEVSSDRLFNFVVTAWALVDWIRWDPKVPAAAKAARGTLSNEALLQLCRDLANGCKHHTIDRYDPKTQTTASKRGYGIGRYGMGAFGEGEEAIEIVAKDGARHDALRLVDGVMELLHRFFNTHGI
jgi:hypothetical protein